MVKAMSKEQNFCINLHFSGAYFLLLYTHFVVLRGQHMQL